VKSFTNDCQIFKSNNLKIDPKPDGTFIPNLPALNLKTPDALILLQEMSVVKPSRKARAAELVTFAKEQAVKIIKKNKTEEQLSEAEKTAIARVRSMTLSDSSSDKVVKNSQCLGVVPNAFYDTETHSMNICPTSLNLPDSQLLLIIAHEAAHTVDPCISQFGIYGVDEQNLKAVEKSVPDSLRNEFRLTSDNIRGTKQTTLEDGPIVDLLLESGSLKTISPSRTSDNYLFKDIYSCLKSSKGGGFRAPSSEEIELEGQRDGIVADYPMCANHGNNMNEAFSDWMASQVVGDFLKDKNLASDEKLRNVSYFAAQACLEKDPNYKIDSHHPPSQMRLEQIVLRNPSTRAALGCLPDTTQAQCEHRETSGSPVKLKKNNTPIGPGGVN